MSGLADRRMAQIAVCESCGLKHRAVPGSFQAIDFFARHAKHPGPLRLLDQPDPTLDRLHHMLGVDLFREVRHTERPDGRERERIFKVDRLGFAGYGDNADVKEAFGTVVSMTKTNANLASSATAGWQSDAIDNTTNLYLDHEFQIQLAAVNTAPASDKTIYLFAFAVNDPTGTAYTSTGAATPSGTEGTLTYPNVSTLGVLAPQLGQIPYLVQNVALNSGPMSHAAACGFPYGVASKLAIGMDNFCGMTLSVTAITNRGVYFTVF